LSVQREIVAEVEGYQRVIDGARTVLDSYRARVPVHPDWPVVELRDVAQLIRGLTFSAADQLEHATGDSILVATTKAAQERGIVEEALYHVPRAALKDENKLLRAGDILISTANSLNLLGRTTHVHQVGRPMSFGAFMSVIRPNEKVLDGYLICCLRSDEAYEFYRSNARTTTNISNLNLSSLGRLPIPLPPMATQRAIVAEIEAEEALVAGNSDLAARFERKIQAALARVWDGKRERAGS
jgi:type I restriction enzyme M protein